MNAFVEQNLKCPEEAVKNAVSGRVYLKFVVTETGNIENIEVLKNIAGCKTCDAEAIRVVQRMPVWKPGKMSGKKVRCYFNLQVRFDCPQ